MQLRLAVDRVWFYEPPPLHRTTVLTRDINRPGRVTRKEHSEDSAVTELD